MDSSDTDGYTAILAQSQRSYQQARRQRQEQQLQLQLQFQDPQLARKRKRYSSNNPTSPTTTSTTSTPCAVLPEYTPEVTSPSASDAPPTYTDVDAEDEGDEEGDDKALPLPMTSSLSRRRSLTTTRTSTSGPTRRSSSLQGKRRSSASKPSRNESNDDLYLDSLLARSVHALELSNALLQSTISTNTSLTSVLHSEDVLDRSLARQQRNISATLREGQQLQAAWMGEMREVVEDVEDLFDDGQHSYNMRDVYWPHAATTTGSLPSTSSSPISSLSSRHPSTRAPLPEHSRTTSSSSGGALRRGERPRSPPPRALTQYVSVAHSKGTTTETTASVDSIFLPSTTGLRAAARVEEFAVPASGRTGLSPVDSDGHRGSGRQLYTQDEGRASYGLHPEAQRELYHMPARASQYKLSSTRPVPPPRRQESSSIAPASSRTRRQHGYISPTPPALLSSLARSTFPDTPEPHRPTLPPFSASPPPRIVIERRPTHTSPPQAPSALAPDSLPRNPYTRRSPPHVAWSTPDLTTASLLLHTLQQPGYRPSPRSEASSTSSRSSSSRYQHQQRPQPQVRQGKVQQAPYSSTFNPERYFADLEPIADSEPEYTRSDFEYDRDKTVRSKGKGRESLLLEDDDERDQATVRSTDKEKGRTKRTFVSAQRLRKLLDTSTIPTSKNDMQVVQQQPPELPQERMTNTSAKRTNHRPIPKRRSTSTLSVAPHFLPSPSTLPSTSTSTATASVARLKAMPPTTEEEEEERRRTTEKRRSGLKGSRQGSAAGTPVMGLTPLMPSSDAVSTPSVSGSSTPRSVSFAVEPPKYSEERERSGEGGNGGRRVERKKKRKEGEEGEKEKEKGGWMSWFLDVSSSGLPPPGTVVSGRLDERMGGRGPGGGAFEFGL